MAAAIGTKILGTGMTGGVYKIVTVTATIASASDDIILTAATHGITAITAIVGAVITGTIDANFSALQVSFSALTLTCVSKQPDGANSDTWAAATIAVTVIGTM